MRTIRTIDEAGQDLRLWCYRCARGGRIAAIVWQLFAERGWDDALPIAATRFRCTECGERDVLILPATRPPMILAGATEQLVAAYFHKSRALAKKAKREQPDVDRLIAAMRAAGEAARQARQQAPYRPPPDLKLIVNPQKRG